MEDYSKYKILVIGETCVDVFVYGRATRLAPEAPVPIFNIDKNTKFSTSKGMAGNVYENLKSLGAQPFILSNDNIITKTRYVEDRTKSIILRIDENDKADKCNLRKLPSYNFWNGEELDAIIISDYDKGFLTSDQIGFICSENTRVFVDTKKILGEWIKDASFIKINNEEYERTNHTLDHLNLKDKLIVTLGGKGCQYKETIFAAKDVPVKHLSGAGDTFMAGLVCEYLRTQNINEAILFAMECATKVIQKEGVSVI
jgi:bifunctional ADP-heptose synthase (sugar kinase/adenylyltransferase)